MPTEPELPPLLRRMLDDVARSIEFREKSARDPAALCRALRICKKRSEDRGNLSRSAADRQAPEGFIFHCVADRRDSRKFLWIYERDKKMSGAFPASVAASPDLAQGLRISRNSARCTADAGDPRPVAKALKIESPASRRMPQIHSAPWGVEERLRRSPRDFQERSADPPDAHRSFRIAGDL